MPFIQIKLPRKLGIVGIIHIAIELPFLASIICSLLTFAVCLSLSTSAQDYAHKYKLASDLRTSIILFEFNCLDNFFFGILVVSSCATKKKHSTNGSDMSEVDSWCFIPFFDGFAFRRTMPSAPKKKISKICAVYRYQALLSTRRQKGSQFSFVKKKSAERNQTQKKFWSCFCAGSFSACDVVLLWDSFVAAFLLHYDKCLLLKGKWLKISSSVKELIILNKFCRA